MQVRTGVGWQYALADLSLILFMVVAAALARQQAAPPKPAPPPPAPAAAPVLAEPVAVWRAGPGAPRLAGGAASPTPWFPQPQPPDRLSRRRSRSVP